MTMSRRRLVTELYQNFDPASSSQRFELGELSDGDNRSDRYISAVVANWGAIILGEWRARIGAGGCIRS